MPHTSEWKCLSRSSLQSISCIYASCQIREITVFSNTSVLYMRGGPSVFNHSSHWEYACYFWESGMQSNALGPLFHSEINKVHGIRRRLPPCTTPSEILISLVNTQVLICIEHFQDGYNSTFQISCLRPVFYRGKYKKVARLPVRIWILIEAPAL